MPYAVECAVNPVLAYLVNPENLEIQSQLALRFHRVQLFFELLYLVLHTCFEVRIR